MRMNRLWLGLLIACSLLGPVPPVPADDYPQWLGPRRDGIWREPQILEKFPEKGPPLRWKTAVGGGYSGPAVSAGRVVVTDRVLRADATPAQDPFKRGKLPGVERVLCFNEIDGKPLWTYQYDCDYTVSYAAGPRCTPTIDGERVYTLGAEGNLACLNLQTGKPIWSMKLEGPTPVWGFAGHPLVDGDLLIVLTSGKEAVVTAFNKLDGKVVWSALKAREPGYSPPLIYTLGGVRTLVIWYPDALVGLDTASGRELWRAAYGPVRYGASIASPLLLQDRFFIASEYEGAAMVQLEGQTTRNLWTISAKGRGINTLVSLMSPRWLVDGVIVGIHTEGPMRAIDPADGRVIWETNQPTIGNDEKAKWSTAFITPWQPEGAAAPQRYFIANEKGDLITCLLSARGYSELSRTRLLEPTNTDARRPALWCHPAYANRSIYWRNDRELGCWSLAR